MRLSRTQLLARQRDDFDAIVRFALRHSPFYARRYAELAPAAGRTVRPQDLPTV